jgi:hypothetical protein
MINNDFFYRNIEVDLIERYSFFQILKSKNRNSKKQFYLFEIREKEFRKSDMLYYSRILTYRIMGILEKNISLYSLFFPYDCSNCFSRMSCTSVCDSCNKKYTEDDFYFININNLFGSNEFNLLKKRFNLGFVSEVYRDQRTSINNFMKEEIVQKALHPDRISKILEMSNDHWHNLDNYI